MDIKDELRTLRLAAGLTQQEVADELDIGATTYRGWEAGRQVPPADKYKRAVLLLTEYADKRHEPG